MSASVPARVCKVTPVRSHYEGDSSDKRTRWGAGMGPRATRVQTPFDARAACDYLHMYNMHMYNMYMHT